LITPTERAGRHWSTGTRCSPSPSIRREGKRGRAHRTGKSVSGCT
jgi:hypothetical protein